MAHQRKLIRDAVIAKLKAANTSAGQRVYGNRAAQIFPNELPCILVYTKSEASEISIESPREYKRDLVVALELVAQAATEDALDDVLDAFAEQVEAAIFNDETHGGLVSDTFLGETEMDILTEGEKPVGAAKISLTMPYYQQVPAAPATPLDAFETAQTTIQVGGASVPDLESSLELPQI